MAHVVFEFLLRPLREMNEAQQPRARDPSPTADDAQDSFRPKPIDIVVTRIMLTRSKRLPPDLIDAIFDFAEYWAHSTTSVNYHVDNQDHLCIRGTVAQDKMLVSRLHSAPVRP